jgi:hypothetical protein
MAGAWSGASTLGYTWWNDSAQAFEYGGKLRPELPGWAVQWGDPAATVAEDAESSYVYIAGLAAPDEQMPYGDHWIDGPDTEGRFAATGGACIYASWDGGASFHNLQCVYDETTGGVHHFYDGGNMASGNGAIYGALV